MVLFGSDTIRRIIILCLTILLIILIILGNKSENDLLILVNNDNPLSRGFSPSIKTYEGFYVAKEALEPLKEMVHALNNSNISFKITEAYVSISMQEMKFESKIKEYEKDGLSRYDAKLKAASEVLLPRYSEHHTALALDFEGEDDLYDWLEANSYKYGFILRYPFDKKEITKYEYDKTHYRYVGKEAAIKMKNNNLCLEEYLEEEK